MDNNDRRYGLAFSKNELALLDRILSLPNLQVGPELSATQVHMRIRAVLDRSKRLERVTIHVNKK
jgi:hypothetical protein